MATSKLPVDLYDLVDALTWNDYMIETYRYLDRETGKVITIQEDELADDDLDGDVDEGEGEGGDEFRQQAKLVEEHPERFIEIEPIESHEAFRIMEDFVDEVKVDVVRRRLMRALTARRKPFRAFKNALEEFPEARQQWFDFEAERHLAMAREWLAAQGIETTWQPPEPQKK